MLRETSFLDLPATVAKLSAVAVWFQMPIVLDRTGVLQGINIKSYFCFLTTNCFSDLTFSSISHWLILQFNFLFLCEMRCYGQSFGFSFNISGLVYS